MKTQLMSRSTLRRNADARIFRDRAAGRQRLGEEGSEDAEDHRADEDRKAGELPGREERQGDAGQDAVTNGVAEHAHALEQEETAEQGARNAARGGDRDRPESAMELRIGKREEHQVGSSPARNCFSKASRSRRRA
jgi:hypothetical protein